MTTAKNSAPGRVRRISSAQPRDALNARGLKSRERLKQAALATLNDLGYRNMRIQDVTVRAGVANGLFYHYFRDMREAVAEVAEDFFAALVEDTAALKDQEDPFDWIFDNHLIVVEKFARNPGVLACLFGLAGDYEEFDKIWKQNAHTWNLQVAEFLEAEADLETADSIRLAFVLGAMTEGVIYQSLIRRTEDLIEFADTPSSIAEVIATMWYRAIFLRNPPDKKLKPTGRLLAGNRTKKRSLKKND